MPFKSEKQRRLFYTLHEKGEMPMSTIKEWESKTPEEVKKSSLLDDLIKESLCRISKS